MEFHQAREKKKKSKKDRKRSQVTKEVELDDEDHELLRENLQTRRKLKKNRDPSEEAKMAVKKDESKLVKYEADTRDNTKMKSQF